MYLIEMNILWWKRCHADMKKGLCKINTWAELKRELKKHFYLKNIKFLVYKKLRKLRHEVLLREYMKEYSTLLLEILDMANRGVV